MLSVDALNRFTPAFRCDAWVFHCGSEIFATRSGAAIVNGMEVDSGLNTFEGIVVEVLKWGPLKMSRAERRH
jgi:hypothetical protein